MTVSVATCQFPVSADVQRNLFYILKQLCDAKDKKADIVHFPECALSGYAGTDFKNLKDMDWRLLSECLGIVKDECRRLKIWTVLGSTHQVKDAKPYNSLYVIDRKGRIKTRYDKLFCAGNKKQTSGDLQHYCSGKNFKTFKLKGFVCGLLICHDYRYPELYREYKKKGVELMFHSYHAGGINDKTYADMQDYVGRDYAKFSGGSTIPEITMPATMVSYAANNYMWISCPNSCRKNSCWPAFMVRPDGVIVNRLKRHQTGITITKVTKKPLYDSTRHWRTNALNGVFHSGD